MKKLKENFDITEFFEKVLLHNSVLMLDYDGTLAPFTNDRMRAFPYAGIIQRLTTLAKSNKTRIVIVSGRSLSDLETLLKIPHIDLWGSHGLEQRLANGKKKLIEIDPKMREILELGIAICKKFVGEKQCEIKPYSVALHWRGIDKEKILESIVATEREWEKICHDYPYEIHRFDGGLELRPQNFNKGNVVESLLAETPKDQPIAYLGDDMTDEDAFKALGDNGLKVLVREQPRETLADIILTPPDELLCFLDKWILNSKNFEASA